MGLCTVCESAEAEFHFGGYSCRACAAFFRRYVHSKKRSILCVCKSQTKSVHPCRHCRMIKCLKAGLQRNKVQPLREPNSPSISVEEVGSEVLVPCISVKNRIISRGCSKIYETASQWGNYNARRKLLYGEDAERLNFYEVSCLTKTDAMIMWQMTEELFPSVKKLKMSDMESLMSNFMSKFILMESAHEAMLWFRTPHEYSQYTEENREMLYNFYNGAIPEKHKMKRDEVEKIFWPLWAHYYDKIIIPIYDKRHDLMETMAQLLLILFDPAYINISEECAEQCRSLRNMILRELRGYLTDKNQPETRFFDVLDNLNLIEKADAKFQEEILICDMYNVKLHEDFRRIFVVEKL